MGTQRFDVGASASPAERTVKDSPVEFPLWPTVPAASGLFDPRHEKDSCGVGFIADIKGRKSHKIVEDAIAILCNLEHRGAVGADPRAGDGAGILVQMPHKFFVRKAEELDIHLPEPGHYAVGYVFMPHDPEWRKVILDIYAEKIPQEGLTLLGWREVPHDNSSLGESVKPTEPFHMQVFIGRGAGHQVRGRVRAPALHPAQGHLRRRVPQARAAACELLRRVAVVPHDHLQGHVPRRPARQVLSRPARARLRDRARARAPALLDQHVPVLAARAPLSHGRAQRRDQHAARQRQLDGGAAGLGVVQAVRRRHQEALADLLRGPVGHRLLRQRARIPGAGRLLARARRHDADPGSLGRQSADG